MAQTPYDVIVVGARCAGSPAAMLLARKGYKVLVVDKATFPSDTISTHLIHPRGMDSLTRWGLVERVLETGSPSIETYRFDFGPFVISGSPRKGDLPASSAPRRTVLDEILVDAAAKSGAEIRQGFTVDDILIDNDRVVGIRGHSHGGQPVTERARIVLGADGRHSMVASAVGAEEYNTKPELLAAYYTYWSGLPIDAFETFVRPYQSFAAWPTNDGLALVIAGWQFAKFEANKKDIEGNYHKVIEMVPSFAERVRGAKREERFVGTAVRGYFRKPYGPGWALAGDAGYNKDFITAQGIQDAFRDAESCVKALDESLSGIRPFESAMEEYRTARDQHVFPMYEFTAELASQEPPPPQMQQLLGAVHGNREAMDGFVQTVAGTISPAEFFAEDNVKQIFSAAAG